jgi:lipopolysaccharide biosynthesis glycosyltransferase
VKPIGNQTRIPLVFASDESYAMPLATALRSIVEAKRTVDPLEVYILYSTFQDRTRTRVMNSLPPGSISIHWVAVDLTRFEACWTTPYLSAMTYARLMIPEMLPQCISKVLYLDADILVFDDLIALQEIDLNDAAVGAVLDRLDSRIKAGETLWTNDLPCVRNYFNAGVLLIDLERWREDRVSERAFDYLIQHPRSPLSDQDALNVVCNGAWRQLEPRWNFLNDYETQMLGTAVGKGPAIVHFAGRLKPWQAGVLDPNARLYDLIRSRTRFARTTRDKVRDSVEAPLRFFQSGLWSQLKRALRRNETLRRIRLKIIHANRVKAPFL